MSWPARVLADSWADDPMSKTKGETKATRDRTRDDERGQPARAYATTVGDRIINGCINVASSCNSLPDVAVASI